MSKQQVLDNVASIESLLPDLSPNLDKMKASDWVKLLKDPNRVATMLVMLKSYYPNANVSKIISRNPKILLQDVNKMEGDAKKVGSVRSRDKTPRVMYLFSRCTGTGTRKCSGKQTSCKMVGILMGVAPHLNIVNWGLIECLPASPRESSASRATTTV